MDTGRFGEGEVDQGLVLGAGRILLGVAAGPDGFADDPHPGAGMVGDERGEQRPDDLPGVAPGDRDVGRGDVVELALVEGRAEQVEPGLRDGGQHRFVERQARSDEREQPGAVARRVRVQERVVHQRAWGAGRIALVSPVHPSVDCHSDSSPPDRYHSL